MIHIMTKASHHKRILPQFSLSVFVMMFFIMFSSCTVRQPKGILSQGKLEDVLYDYQMARAIAMQSVDSSEFRAKVYTDAVLNRYDITRAEFDASMLWYAQHTDKLYSIYENIQKRLDKEAAALGSSVSAVNDYAGLSSKGDTANVWNGRRFYILTSKGLDNRFTFVLNADTSYHAEDRIVWHFNSQFVYSSGSRDATVSMTIWYNNDSTACVTQRMYSDGEFSVEVTAVGHHKIKKIMGFIYLNAPWSDDQKLLVVRQISIIHYHKPVLIERPQNNINSLKTDTDSARRLRPANNGTDSIHF